MSQFDMIFEDETLTVSQYTNKIKTLLEGGIPPVWIKGEISNLRKQSSGHLYFSIKDAKSQLPAVMFRTSASRLSFDVNNGIEVVAFGEISVYEPHGRYQFIVRSLEESGAGRLHREFERLKAKLQAEGLFDASKKRALPRLPLRVGFITSPSGAAVQDFIRILKRRNWPGHLTVLPAKVQGKGAAEEIAEAIEYASRRLDLDLLVVGRGGGSLEDLWCFNEEVVARSLAECSIPTISAVGHEIDFALSDFVADLRAETPSAAAELISSASLVCADQVSAHRQRLRELFSNALAERKAALNLMREQFRYFSPESRIENAYLRLDDLSNRLKAKAHGSLAEFARQLNRLETAFSRLRPDLALGLHMQRLDSVAVRFRRIYQQSVIEKARTLSAVSSRLEVLHPKSTLKRGYAILTDEKSRLITSKNVLKGGDKVKAQLSDGDAWLEAIDD